MPLDFSLQLAPLLPGFHLPGSTCCAAPLSASRHWVQSLVTLCPTGQPRQVPPGHHTTSPPPARRFPPHPGSQLPALVSTHPRTFPPTYRNTPFPEAPLQPLYSTRFSSGRGCWLFPRPCWWTPPPALPPETLNPPRAQLGHSLALQTPSPKAPLCQHWPLLWPTRAEAWSGPASSQGPGEPKHCYSVQSHRKLSSFLSCDRSENDAQQVITGTALPHLASLYFTSLAKKHPGKHVNTGMPLKSCFYSANQTFTRSAPSTESFQRWLCKQEFFTYRAWLMNMC